MGPPLCAERDSVLLTRLPGNYDVTGVHDKEQHHGRERLRDAGRKGERESAADAVSRCNDKL